MFTSDVRNTTKSTFDIREEVETKREKKAIEPKRAIYYLKKARYKPGVNISEMLNKNL